jgi:hypothetical protein
LCELSFLDLGDQRIGIIDKLFDENKELLSGALDINLIFVDL